MGVRILVDYRDYELSCFYDSVTETAFGPLFHASDSYSSLEGGYTSEEVALAFLYYLAEDARTYTSDELSTLLSMFLKDSAGLKWVEHDFGWGPALPRFFQIEES